MSIKKQNKTKNYSTNIQKEAQASEIVQVVVVV